MASLEPQYTFPLKPCILQTNNSIVERSTKLVGPKLLVICEFTLEEKVAFLQLSTRKGDCSESIKGQSSPSPPQA